MSTKKTTAGAATPNGQKENNANIIIAVPLDVVNMSDEEIITAAVGLLTIMFLRKRAEPNKPFYTIEVDNSGIIRQCYGDHNTPATAEIEAFRKRYQHYLTEVFENEKRTERKLQQSA